MKYLKLLLTSPLLIVILTFSSCTANIYTISQLQRNEELINKLVNKKVEIRTYEDKLISGYLCEVRIDSTVVRLKKRRDTKIAIPNQEIKLITKYKDVDPAALGAIAFLLVIIILSAEGVTIGH